MYKQAAQLKLRFSTNLGQLSAEQLWDLTLPQLDQLAVSLEEAYKKSKGKSFLDTRTTKDAMIKLQFDIVLDVLTTKKEASDTAKAALAVKAHNNKILELIAGKKDEALAGKSIEELEKMLQ